MSTPAAAYALLGPLTPLYALRMPSGLAPFPVQAALHCAQRRVDMTARHRHIVTSERVSRQYLTYCWNERVEAVLQERAEQDRQVLLLHALLYLWALALAAATAVAVAAAVSLVVAVGASGPVVGATRDSQRNILVIVCWPSANYVCCQIGHTIQPPHLTALLPQGPCRMPPCVVLQASIQNALWQTVQLEVTDREEISTAQNKAFSSLRYATVALPGGAF